MEIHGNFSKFGINYLWIENVLQRVKHQSTRISRDYIETEEISCLKVVILTSKTIKEFCNSGRIK